MKITNNLYNISPIDGRYHEKTDILSPFLSEYALIKYRVIIELQWLIFLIQKNIITEKNIKQTIEIMKSIIDNFSLDDAEEVKKIEETTKHDVKAIEYFLQNKFNKLNINHLNPYIHFTLTSEDINNLSYSLMINDALNKVYLPHLNKLINKINELSSLYKNRSMLSHTHGQNATPTTLGKEFKVFAYRLKSILELITNLKLKGKLNGTVGNYNCHIIAYPNIDWISLSKEFVNNLNLQYNPVTTQIESHDILSVMLSYLKISNNILKDLNSDMWLYISRNYLTEKAVKNEVGSSVMPHKVNPINHENSMANVEISNGLIDALVNNLSISRMQRDLSDSSKLRNIGVILGHSLIAINQTIIGLNKISVNDKLLDDELENSYNVLTEAVQTILRKNNIPNAYEKLKELSRGKEITKYDLHQFINNLNINKEDKDILLNLTPKNYTGLASKIVDNN